MKLFLHIGTEKTGTTSLQEMLKINRAKLHKVGIYIPKKLGRRNHFDLVSYCMNIDIDRFDDYWHRQRFIKTKAEKKKFNDKFINEFKGEFGNIPHNIDTVVITSEFFHSKLLFQEEIDRLKEVLQPYFDEIKIICYLRNQIDLIASKYSTDLISGRIVDNNIDIYAEKMVKKNNHYYNYKKMLCLWENSFGRENIILKLFDKQEFYKNSLYDDFLTIFLKNDFKELRFPETQNKSLNAVGEDLMNILNKKCNIFTENVGWNKTHKVIKDILLKSSIGKGKKLSYDEALNINKQFAESNQYVCNAYFPKKNKLFEIELEKYKKEDIYSSDDYNRVFEDMINIVINNSKIKESYFKKKYKHIVNIIYNIVYRKYL